MKDPQESQIIKISAKQRWKDAVEKFRRAIIPEQPELTKLSDNLVDCVRVGVFNTIEMDRNKPYLEEIARGKQTLNSIEYPILRMNEEELKSHQLFYNQASEGLTSYNNETATTIGKESKYTKNIQAFIMAKDGSVYMGTHKGHYDPLNPILTHASFLGGRPAEMAGMLSINENGKINKISSDSGHYAPQPLDMYRGIKKLQESMPGVFTLDCIIKYHDKTPQEVSVNQFMENMEKLGVNGKPLYQDLRDHRVEQYNQNTENLKNSVSVKINSINTGVNDLPNIIATLTSQQQQELATGLTNPMVGLSITDQEKKCKTYNISETVVAVLNSGRADSMKVLIDAGISNRSEFNRLRPIYQAASCGKTEMLTTMLDDQGIQKSLIQEKSYSGPSALHMAAGYGHTEAVKILLKYSEGCQLLTAKDHNGNTALEVANQFGKHDIADILTQEHLNLAKTQLLQHFKEQMEDKNIITSSHQKEMKKKVIEILSPFSRQKNKNDIEKVAGTMVREVARIAGKNLDWKQKFAEIGDVIKIPLLKMKTSFLNIISGVKEQKIKGIILKDIILQDKDFASELTKLRNNQFMSANGAISNRGLVSSKQIQKNKANVRRV